MRHHTSELKPELLPKEVPRHSTNLESEEYDTEYDALPRPEREAAEDTRGVEEAGTRLLPLGTAPPAATPATR